MKIPHSRYTPISFEQALAYEIRSMGLFIEAISFMAPDFVTNFLIRRTKRKFNKYAESVEFEVKSKFKGIVFTQSNDKPGGYQTEAVGEMYHDPTPNTDTEIPPYH